MSRASLLLCVAVTGCASAGASWPVHDAAGGPRSEVHFIGRFDDMHRFAWPGSMLVARFSGTGIAVTLEERGINSYTVTVDGVARPVLMTAVGLASYPLASGLTDGEHVVTVARRTESSYGVTRFVGFTGAILVPSTAPFQRHIEFIGDSITAGYGVLGTDETCEPTATNSSELDSWAGLTATALGAAQTAVAYSGKGAFRDYEGSTAAQMPALYDRTFADDPQSSWPFVGDVADVVVIGLGTNDFRTGDPGDDFVTALAGLVAKVRRRHPDAWIVLASSAMLRGDAHASQLRHLTTVATTAAAAGDARVTTLDVPTQLATDGMGCKDHPSSTTAHKMAALLTAKIRSLTGW